MTTPTVLPVMTTYESVKIAEITCGLGLVFLTPLMLSIHDPRRSSGLFGSHMLGLSCLFGVNSCLIYLALLLDPGMTYLGANGLFLDIVYAIDLLFYNVPMIFLWFIMHKQWQLYRSEPAQCSRKLSVIILVTKCLLFTAAVIVATSLVQANNEFVGTGHTRAIEAGVFNVFIFIYAAYVTGSAWANHKRLRSFSCAFRWLLILYTLLQGLVTSYWWVMKVIKKDSVWVAVSDEIPRLVIIIATSFQFAIMSMIVVTEAFDEIAFAHELKQDYLELPGACQRC